MTRSETDNLFDENAWPTPSARTAKLVCCAAGLMCAAFTAVASWTLLAAAPFEGMSESSGFYLRLWIKAIAFTLFAAGFAWTLRRAGREAPPSTPEAGTSPGHAWGLLALTLVVVAALAFPRLGAYPRAEPDETYHLNVARNLAQYGVYASGHPETGFVLFDSNDSVGPPIIAPIAAMFRVFGPNLLAARLFVAAFYVLWSALLYFLLRPVFGARGAALGALLGALAEGSIYLGRTLYGEAPALAFGLAGLVIWRRALVSPRAVLTGLAAGLCFGLAVLCKTIVLLAVWPVAATWAYDRVSHRRIRFSRLFWPAVGAAIPLFAWWLIQKSFANDAAANTFPLYRHYLMFGFGGVAPVLRWLAHEPASTLALAAVVLSAAPALFERRYDPPVVVLYFLIPFFAYWWVFFTPGNIPRYAWYFNVAGAALGGGLLVWGMARLATARASRVGRAVGAIAVTLLLAPGLLRAESQGVRIAVSDEMAPDRALALRLAALPPGTTIGVTLWPLERAMNFLSGRYVQRLRGAADGAGRVEVIIADREEPTPPGFRREAFGPYALFTAPRVPAPSE